MLFYIFTFHNQCELICMIVVIPVDSRRIKLKKNTKKNIGIIAYYLKEVLTAANDRH